MRFILFCLGIALFQTSFVFAQSFGAPVFLSIEPKNPGPNQNVTALIESYSTNLNGATISWFINGQLKEKGVGIKTFLFRTDDVGKTTKLLVTAVTVDGFLIEQQLTISPADVEIFWEADSYTPPFYKGKKLYTHQGDIRLIALPRLVNSSGVQINPSNLIYTWKKDGVVQQQGSGFAKQTLSLTGNFITRPALIELEVTSSDGSIKGSARRTLRSTEAEVLVYEESPLYGTKLEKVLEGNFDLPQEEVTLIAVPYFFSVKNPIQAKYSWLMNSQSVGFGTNSITFRNETGSVGTSRISVKAENISRILQFGSKNFSVTFGETGGESSFFR